MRLLAIIGLILSAPIFAQELDINGYSKVVVPRGQGGWVNSDALLREAARRAGFEVLRSVEEIPKKEWPTTLYMTSGIADAGPQYIFFVLVYDVAMQTRIASCTRGFGDVRPGHVPGGGDGFGKAAINQIVEELGYQGFEQSAQQANWQVQKLVLASAQQQTSAETRASPGKPRMSCRRDGAPSPETD